MTDREKLIEWIEEWRNIPIEDIVNSENYLSDYLISKGVAIPVRCSECEYNAINVHPEKATEDDYETVFCYLYMSDGFVPTDFCSCGERKEE